jgi:hypothetical protein
VQGKRRRVLKYYNRRQSGLSCVCLLMQVQGQSEGQRGTGIPRAQSMHRYKESKLERDNPDETFGSTSQEPEAGGHVEMCRYVLPKPTLNTGCFKISSWTTIQPIKI